MSGKIYLAGGTERNPCKLSCVNRIDMVQYINEEKMYCL